MKKHLFSVFTFCIFLVCTFSPLLGQLGGKAGKWSIQLNIQHQDNLFQDQIFVGQLGVIHKVRIRPYYSLDIQKSFFKKPQNKFYLLGQLGYFSDLYNADWLSYEVGLGYERQFFKRFFFSLRVKTGLARLKNQDVQYVYENETWVKTPNPDAPVTHGLLSSRLDMGYKLLGGDHPLDLVLHTQISILRHVEWGDFPMEDMVLVYGTDYDRLMKICLAQVQSYKGDIAENIKKHVSCIEAAAELGADAIFFPELSLTGYEPSLARQLATTLEDPRFLVFQDLSTRHDLLIGVGMPIKSKKGIHISLLIFQSGHPRRKYVKQFLHEDEVPYFEPGEGQVILDLGGKKLGLAICYESLLPAHIDACMKLGTDIYIASVAKSSKGIDKADAYFPILTNTHEIPVCMVNAVGPSDDFVSAGMSAYWDKKGRKLKQLDGEVEGILLIEV